MIEGLKELIKELADALPKASRISANYSGSGDSGDIDSAYIIYPKDENWHPLRGTVSSDLYDKTESMIDRIIDCKVGGYENNEGGFGVVTINLPSQKAFIKHNYYENISTACEKEEV